MRLHRGFGRSGSRRTGQGALTPDAPTLALAHSAPDAELLAILQCVFEAVLAYHAAAADLLGLSGRGSPLGEEKVRIDTETVGKIMPSRFIFLGRAK